MSASVWRWSWLLLLLHGCVGTRLVRLENLDVSLPAPSDGWRGEMRGLLDMYERAPVLAPDDEQLHPLFGGLTTLSYFGADAKARAFDQRIVPAEVASGTSLEQGCAAPFAAAPIGADVPGFAGVWIPLAIHGGQAPAAVSCDEHGRALGEDAEQSFCMFARTALQPGGPHPLIVVVHGLFDSSAQYYVQRTAAVLYQHGYSVLLPDLRDHGDTLRAAPRLATTLGVLEGPDLLALAKALRQSCALRVSRLGLAGISGGALASLRAFTLDSAETFDAGVLALSPLLDVDTAITDLSQTGPCPITRAIELTWTDVALLTAASGIATFAGAALERGLDGKPVDGSTALAGGIGAGVGAALGLAADAWFDGSGEACVSQNAIAQMVQDALRLRWRTLRTTANAEGLSPAGRKLDPSAITLEDYVRERVQYAADREHISLRHFSPQVLAAELRHSLQVRDRSQQRLMVLGAEDDPMTRAAALHAFVERTRGLAPLYTRAVRSGGHAALLLVQPTVMEAVYSRFFRRD
jgi:dienelactone hydrolase